MQKCFKRKSIQNSYRILNQSRFFLLSIRVAFQTKSYTLQCITLLLAYMHIVLYAHTFEQLNMMHQFISDREEKKTEIVIRVDDSAQYEIVRMENLY